jgi:hypothetical protein
VRHVIEVASNDSALLQRFSKIGIPVIGIEPDHASVVRAMTARGIPTLAGSFAAAWRDARRPKASTPISLWRTTLRPVAR